MDRINFFKIHTSVDSDKMRCEQIKIFCIKKFIYLLYIKRFGQVGHLEYLLTC